MKCVLFYFIAAIRSPYNCNIFMQDLQVGVTSAVYYSGLCNTKAKTQHANTCWSIHVSHHLATIHTSRQADDARQTDATL